MHKTVGLYIALILMAAMLVACGGGGSDYSVGNFDSQESTSTAADTPDETGNAAMHLEYVSASHELIALKNTGGPPRSETSVLTFKVTDINGSPVSGQVIEFELSTEVGNIFLSKESDVSDASGLVQTTVNAGTVSTEIKVHATAVGVDPLVTVVSDTLIISTGLADQNSISISVDRFNPEGWNYNNVEVEVVFQAADHFNNFVPDGTVVYFTTELGSIDESCALKDGVCKAIWRSGNPRDSYCDDSSNLDDLNDLCQPGISTITAFLIGEESFTDFNGNGYFEPEVDEFLSDSDMGEPFRDDNDDGERDEFEPWWDFNGNGVYDGPNGIYNGSLCMKESEKCTKRLVYVQDSINISMSGAYRLLYPQIIFNLALEDPGTRTLEVHIADINGNPMPVESKVEILNVSDDDVSNSFAIPNTLFKTVYSVRVYEPGSYKCRITTPAGEVFESNTLTIN